MTKPESKHHEQALADNARLCMGEPSGAEFPPAPEMQMLFAKRLRKQLLGVVDEYNRDEFPELYPSE